MPALNLGSDYTAGELATAAIFNARFQAILDWANTTKLDHDNIQDGAITLSLLSAALQQAIGVGASSRGKSVVAAEGTRTNAAYGQLDNGPDQVSNLVVPTDGLLVIRYEALLKGSLAGNGQAAIFIGSNQLQARVSATGVGSTPKVVEAQNNAGSGNYGSITCHGGAGLVAVSTGANTTALDVTTGQTLGGISDSGSTATVIAGGTGLALSTPPTGQTIVKVAAGTYTVSVQFRATPSGTVFAKSRSLQVEVVPFS